MAAHTGTSTRRMLDRPFAPRDPNIPSGASGAKQTRTSGSAPPTASESRAKSWERTRTQSPEPMQGNGAGSREVDAESESDVQLNEEDTQDSFMKQIIRDSAPHSKGATAHGHGRAQSEVLGQERMQAFRKARTRPRPSTGLTIENLQRHTDIITPAPPEVRSKSSLGSVSSAERNSSTEHLVGRLEGGLNVPYEWGRKAKRNPQWIRRIKTDHAGPYADGNGVNGNADWQDVAKDVPLPTVEVDDSPLSRRSSNRGTPASLKKRGDEDDENEDPLQFSDDSEFREANFLTSTPAPRRGDTLEDIRRREREAALDESVYPTPPRDRTRSRSRPRTPPTVQKVQPTKSNAESLRASYKHSTEQESKPASKTSNRGANGPSSRTEVSQQGSHPGSATKREATPDVQRNPTRPQHHREDSRDILRRLSRTPSVTPSPAQVRTEKASLAPKLKVTSPLEGDETKSTSSQRQSALNQTNSAAPYDAGMDQVRDKERRSPSDKTSTHDDGKRNKADAEQTQSAPLDSIEREPSSEDDTIYSTSANGQPPKTPVVTGAWVDTTLGPDLGQTTMARPSILDDAVRSSPRKSPAKRAEAAKQREVATSARPPPLRASSALARIVAEQRERAAQRGGSFELGVDDVEALGEATIQSLEDLLGPASPDTAPMVDFDDDTVEKIEVPSEMDRKNMSPGEKARLAEMERIRAMNRRIHKLQGDMRIMHKGVNNIEKMAQQTPGQLAIEDGKTPSTTTGAECDICQHPVRQLYLGLRRTFPIYEKDRRKWLGWRFGRGFWVLLLLVGPLLYTMAEVGACLLFCRPVYADSIPEGGGYGLYPDAPEFPHVLPTLAWRWVFGWWLGWAVPLVKPGLLWLLNLTSYLFMETTLVSEDGMDAAVTAGSAKVVEEVTGLMGDAEYGLGQDMFL